MYNMLLTSCGGHWSSDLVKLIKNKTKFNNLKVYINDTKKNIVTLSGIYNKTTK